MWTLLFVLQIGFGLLHVYFVVCSTYRLWSVTCVLCCLFYRQASACYMWIFLFVLQIGMGLLHVDCVVCSTDRHGPVTHGLCCLFYR